MDKLIFDTETTSADKEHCRIVQLAIRLVDENGTVLVNKSKLYNPGVGISPEATKVHGITMEMVKDAPTFKSDAKKLKALFEGKTLVGYNIIVFDIPVLLNEFERAGVDIDLSGDVIDVMKLETALNPRTLGAVYKRYAGKDFENAHDALADVMATEQVLDFQMKKIKKDKLVAEELIKQAGIPEGSADYYGKLKIDSEGFLIFNFGKEKNNRIIDKPEYANWILNNSFPTQIKKLIQDEQKKVIQKTFKKKDQGFYNPPPDAVDDLPF